MIFAPNKKRYDIIFLLRYVSAKKMKLLMEVAEIMYLCRTIKLLTLMLSRSDMRAKRNSIFDLTMQMIVNTSQACNLKNFLGVIKCRGVSLLRY